MSILSFRDSGIENVFDGLNTARARKTLPTELHRIAYRRFTALNSAVSLDDLRLPPGNQLEVLKGDRKGQQSIRINDQYRICFRWTIAGPADVEIVDYH